MKGEIRRTEPAGTTLADLFILVIGCALALSLPRAYLMGWEFHGCGASEIPPPNPLDGKSWFETTTEFSLKFELALALVALLRCWRWNRTPRAAEWLAILPVLFLPELIKEGEPRFFIYDSWPFYSGPCTWVCKPVFLESRDLVNSLLGASTGLACLAPIAWLRGRMPARIKTILMIGAAYGFVLGPASLARSAIFDILLYFDPDPPRRFPWALWNGLQFLGTLPIGLIFGIMALAACRTRKDVRWMGCAAFLCLVPFAFFTASQRNVVRELVPRTIWLALVIPLSLLAMRRLGPSWNRCFGLDSDEATASPRPSEA